MAPKKHKVDLSTLPMHIRKKSRQWFFDSKTGKSIHVSNIANYLPKQPIETEPVEYWWNKN